MNDARSGVPLAIICGGGSFPAALADAVAARGRRPVMFGVKGWADPKVVERYPHHWIAIGQAGRFFRLARAENCHEVLFIGAVLRPPITQLRLDWRTVLLMPRVIRFFRGGDDKLLSGVAKVAESGGLRVVGVKEVAPELFVPEGVLGRHRPSERDTLDIERALKVIASLGPFDVGQAAVVANGYVLAVEAAEGTDNMLGRISELRRLGRVTSPSGVGVLVKAPKPGQDRRFDLPSIGPRTIEHVARAGLAGLAVAAGNTMIAEPEQAIATADRERVFIVGVREGTA
ncbi:MAG TPA: UDP-2,3-diacylglucosamine diphosphatase LpxI [Xanthobacteraceae bacterium]|nr:UDP-2,3-diacylglucosamine diphosphatase LpxI [Xanthobacteraceae bacterium]